MTKYIQHYTSFEEAQGGSYNSPEILYLNDGTDSKIVYYDEGNDDEKLELLGSNIPEATFQAFCLAKGTMVLMTNGKEVAIEEIAEGEMVSAFNHEIGGIEGSKACIAFKGDGKRLPVILHFSNGKDLSIVGRHGLLEEVSRKYIAIGSGNVSSFVGRRFYSASDGAWVELIGYEIGSSMVEYYSLYSMDINCITNGMLSAPDDLLFSLNVYELDEQLKADGELLASEIEKYGLFDVEKQCPEHPERWETIYALGKYVNIAMAKGLVTIEELKRLYTYWG